MKLGLWCNRFHISFGEQGYSELTPGCCGSIECWKGHFSHLEPTEEEFRECIAKANTCKDFLLEAEVKRYLEGEEKP